MKEVRLTSIVDVSSSDPSCQVVSNCPRGHLENVASALWAPLFEISSTGEETTRNVAAACLGQLATANPSQYLPELQVSIGRSNTDLHRLIVFLQGRLTDESASVRGTVVAAIRYTFADNTQTYDDLLAPLILQFVPLIQDSNLVSVYLHDCRPSLTTRPGRPTSGSIDTERCCSEQATSSSRAAVYVDAPHLRTNQTEPRPHSHRGDGTLEAQG